VACIFHDIGKIKMPDRILRKKSPLTEKEREEMMRHTLYAEEILHKAPSLNKYVPAVRHHHEWYDGRGYPDGLSGDSIPLFAAIISITDAFDAMTTDRPYRKALSDDVALKEITNLSGKQFRPDLVEIFVKIIKTTAA
jgi:HD-GYP domain-containing protein (c-di-GMP phosphodiesterase class II)